MFPGVHMSGNLLALPAGALCFVSGNKTRGNTGSALGWLVLPCMARVLQLTYVLAELFNRLFVRVRCDHVVGPPALGGAAKDAGFELRASGRGAAHSGRGGWNASVSHSAASHRLLDRPQPRVFLKYA